MPNQRPLKKAASPPSPSLSTLPCFATFSLLRASISCKPDFCFARDFERRCAEGTVGFALYEPADDDCGGLKEHFDVSGASSEGWYCATGAEIVVSEDMVFFLILGNK
jgi:hypothetical protein